MTWIFFFFWPCLMASEIFVLQPGLNLGPQHKEHGVLSTGPPGNSQCEIFNSNFSYIQYFQRDYFCTYEELILITVFWQRVPSTLFYDGIYTASSKWYDARCLLFQHLFPYSLSHLKSDSYFFAKKSLDRFILWLHR